MPLPKKLRTSEAENNNNNNVATQHKKSAASKTVLKKSKATTKTVAAAAPPQMPPHPDDKINVDKMIVNDLRKELRKRQLSTSGRKAELQTRLREYLAEAKQTREAEWAAKHAAVITTVVEEEEEDDEDEEVIEETTTKIKQVKIDSGKKNVNEMDVVMEDANEEEAADVSMRSVSDEAMPMVQNKKSDPPATKSVENPSVMKSKKQQLAPKSALKTSKYTAGQSTPQIDDVVEKQSSKHVSSSSVKEQLVPTKISDSSVDSAAVSKSSKVQPSSVQKTKVLTSSTPSGSAFKANVGGGTASGSNSKLMEKKKVLSAASEARKARLAEMRQKVRVWLYCMHCVFYLY